MTDFRAAAMSDAERQDLLVECLVGTKWRDQYLNDAEFRLAIKTLARWLPLWIDSLGLAAYQRKREFDAAIAREMMQNGRVSLRDLCDNV